MNTKFIPKNIISTLAISKRTFFLLKATPKTPIQNINPLTLLFFEKARSFLFTQSHLILLQLLKETKTRLKNLDH
jgi:hypothetical protein